MKKTWFYKLLFSYLPVFFIVISFLVVVFFLSMGEVTRNAAEAVNQGSAKHALGVIDHSLRSVEFMMIKEMMSTDGLHHFFNKSFSDEPYQRMVKPSDKLRELVTQFPIIHSIYMVRWEDETVLTDDSAVALAQFEDRAFAENYLSTREGSNWTGLRSYREFKYQNAANVVTMVKPYPLPAGEQGIIVVNVSGKALQDLVRDLFDSGFVHALLVDRGGNRLYASDQAPLMFEGTVMEIQSDYTGWVIRSQFQGGVFYEFATRFSTVLLLSGAAAIAVAVVYITYISRRHYRPIRSLTERVHSYALSKAELLLKNGGKDEFSFIETALDRIIEQSDELLFQQEENLQIRKRQWIKETLEGGYDTVGPNWPDVSGRFGWNGARNKAAVVVIEIDRFMEFCEKYTKRDQSLLKFLIHNVVTEIAQHRGLIVFGDWSFPYKWSAFLQLKEGDAEQEAAMFARQAVSWIQSNLDFNVTIGLGDIAGSPEDICSSYEKAVQALDYKMILGTSRVIGYWEVPESTQGTNRRTVFDIRRLVQSFKLGEMDWEGHYSRFVKELRTGAAPKEELLHHIHYFIYQLSREFMELNAEYQSIWSEETLPRLDRLMKGFDTFEELDSGLRDILRDTQQRLTGLREERAYSSTMKQVRHYIYENYNNPDLSLNHLSTAFDIHPKYVSHLFKEEFGEKFVEYLANVRMGKAKQLLDSTDLSVQEVALQVGYTHSFSFIRVFKKAIGMTPGDYRKQIQS